METTMKLAIETYSNLTNQSFDKILELSLLGDEVVNKNIMKLMFSLA